MHHPSQPSFDRWISLFTLTFVLTFTVFAKDARVGRAQVMATISEQDIQQQTLRFKIIRSRLLILYMQDILPGKGNPYAHMAQFSSAATLPAFNTAQSINSSEMNQILWLPTSEGQTIQDQDLNDHNRRAIIEYFAQFVAIYEIMKDKIQPILTDSIIVGSVEETTSPEVRTQFDKAWRFLSYIAEQYKTLLAYSPASRTLLVQQKKKSQQLVISQIAKGMKVHIDQVSSDNNRDQLESFLTDLENLADRPVTDSGIADTKHLISQITGKNSSRYQIVKAALNSVDLPETGDIDGAAEAFEIAMRLELGFDILQKMMSDVKEKW